MSSRRHICRFARLSTLPICLLLVGLSASHAWAAEMPARAAFKPDQFLKSWLILKPIPVARDGQGSPDEAAQKAAFAKDWLAEQGGEAKVQPQPGLKQTISGTELPWQEV